MEKLDILKTLVFDDEDEIVYKESFKINPSDLEEILKHEYDVYKDVEEFMENYEPETDGVAVYNIACKHSFDIEEEVVDVFGEEEADDKEELDLSEYESLDDED